MIKVNLLKNKAVFGDSGKAAKPETSGGLASDISKAGFSKRSLTKKSPSADLGFDTFECSPLSQFIKLILLVGFVVPLVAYEKMRANSGKVVISAKNRELQSYQTIRFDKQKALDAYSGLGEKKEIMLVRDKELLEIRKNRLTALYGVDELQTTVPSDVWLTSVSYSESGRLDVSGQTLLDSGLDRFVEALKASTFLERVTVQQDVKTKSKTGRTLNAFKITMTVSNEPEKRAAKELDGR